MMGVTWQRGWNAGVMLHATVGPFVLRAKNWQEGAWLCTVADTERLTDRIIFEVGSAAGEVPSAEAAKAACEAALSAELAQRGWRIERIGRTGLCCIVRPRQDQTLLRAIREVLEGVGLCLKDPADEQNNP